MTVTANTATTNAANTKTATVNSVAANTETANAHATWPASLRIRPAADLDAVTETASVEVADVANGERIAVSPEALAAHILGNDMDADSAEWQNFRAKAAQSDALIPGWQHWQHRAWHPSDQFYLASRLPSADGPELSAAQAAELVAGYLRTDGPPPAPAAAQGTVTPLAAPAEPGDQSIAKLLVNRRTGRSYVRKAPRAQVLSGLLWHGLADIRARRAGQDSQDAATYVDSYGLAWDVCVCVYNVDGVEQGAYRYRLDRHELALVRPGDHREAMTSVLQGMHSPATAGWTLGLVADCARYQWRHRDERALRRLYLETGVLAQELIILGESYGLSTLVTPAQQDRPFLGLHGFTADRHAPMYTLTMGFNRGAAGIALNAPDEPIAADAP